MAHNSAGRQFRQQLHDESPLQVVGVINACCALIAEQAGFKVLYLSGAGVANAAFGLPDLGLTSLNDVCEEVRRVTDASSLPLLVDADTGWGNTLNIAPHSQTVEQSWSGSHAYRRFSCRTNAVGIDPTRVW